MQVNAVIMETVQILNHFAASCDERLADGSRRMLEMDERLKLLAAKLRSIDGQGGQMGGGVSESPAKNLQQVTGSNATASENKRQRSSTLQLAKDDPKMARYLKMLRVGVPLTGVRMQMQVEGLDSSVLDSVLAAA
eukprot:jgi/Mesen1/3168/ME000184S02233